MEKLALIIIDKILENDQIRKTFRNTSYKYVDITIEYLQEYNENVKKYDNELIKLENIEVSQTLLNKIELGYLFEITTAKASNNSYFNDFAKEYDPEITPIYEDEFLINNKNSLEFINLPKDNEIEEILPEVSDGKLYKIKSFISELDSAKGFLKDLDAMLSSNALYYDIYDVDGFLSIITDDNGFEFYIDMGDLSNNHIINNVNPFAILITHFHKDHYNLLQNNSIAAQYYILPYSGSVLYNGKQLYPANQINILSAHTNKTKLLLTGLTKTKGRNALQHFSLNKFMSLYLPKYVSPKNRNLESICIHIKRNNSNVFYPGDTMHYMYSKYLTTQDFYIVSHHGGNVGRLNLNKKYFPNIVINTFSRNHLSNSYIKNLIEYTNHASNLIVGNNNNGKRLLRITL